MSSIVVTFARISTSFVWALVPEVLILSFPAEGNGDTPESNVTGIAPVNVTA